MLRHNKKCELSRLGHSIAAAALPGTQSNFVTVTVDFDIGG